MTSKVNFVTPPNPDTSGYHYVGWSSGTHVVIQKLFWEPNVLAWLHDCFDPNKNYMTLYVDGGWEYIEPATASAPKEII